MDLESIHAFIARDSTFYADAFIADLILKTERLALTISPVPPILP